MNCVNNITLRENRCATSKEIRGRIWLYGHFVYVVLVKNSTLVATHFLFILQPTSDVIPHLARTACEYRDRYRDIFVYHSVLWVTKFDGITFGYVWIVYRKCTDETNSHNFLLFVIVTCGELLILMPLVSLVLEGGLMTNTCVCNSKCS